jgi:uncharacterized protein (TIGR02246 family)
VTDEELKDRLAIADLLAVCTQAGDARKADAYAECFTEDGVLQLAEAIAGREAIRRWMGGASVIPQPKGGTPGFVSHHLTTCKIELTGEDTATARTYWLVTSAAGLDHNGYYDDRLRREDGAWRLAYRRPRTLWISPTSVLHG